MNQNGDRERVGKPGWMAMGAIVGALLLLAIYSNWRHAHRDRFESVTVTRFTPSPSPSPSPSPTR